MCFKSFQRSEFFHACSKSVEGHFQGMFKEFPGFSVVGLFKGYFSGISRRISRDICTSVFSECVEAGLQECLQGCFQGCSTFFKGLLLQNGAKGVSEVQECVQNPGVFQSLILQGSSFSRFTMIRVHF